MVTAAPYGAGYSAGYARRRTTAASNRSGTSGFCAGARRLGAESTGQYLGAAPTGAPAGPPMPKIVPNPFDNTL